MSEEHVLLLAEPRMPLPHFQSHAVSQCTAFPAPLAAVALAAVALVALAPPTPHRRSASGTKNTALSPLARCLVGQRRPYAQLTAWGTPI